LVGRISHGSAQRKGCVGAQGEGGRVLAWSAAEQEVLMQVSVEVR